MKTNDDIGMKIDKISSKLDNIEQKVTINTQQISFIRKYIEGNGQPGILNRVRKLEEWQWKIVGATGILIILIEFIMKFIHL